MKNSGLTLIALCLLFSSAAADESIEPDVAPLLEESCLHCHDADTETRLNFEELGHDLSDPATFRMWQRVFDRVHDGEMPPASEARPDAGQADTALAALRQALRDASLGRQREVGRVPSRRLTRLEYENTVRDLLLVQSDLANMLPEESDTGGFDTVGAEQGISPLHIHKYLEAADLALDSAIRLGPRPDSGPRRVDYPNSPTIKHWDPKPVVDGGGYVKIFGDSLVLFEEFLDYALNSKDNEVPIVAEGLYRVTVEAATHQTDKRLSFNLIHTRRGEATLLGMYDLMPGEPRSVEVVAYCQPGDGFYPIPSRLGTPYGAIGAAGGIEVSGNAYRYKGQGVEIKSFVIDGPLLNAWPPAATHQILSGVQLRKGPEADGAFKIGLTKEPLEHVREIVANLAPRIFRRPPSEAELERFIKLAQPEIDRGSGFVDVIRKPLRSLLSSPQFLFFGGEPGELNDYALASRLSYFLWKSMPDEELFDIAAAGELSDPDVLAEQVDRLLSDERRSRFVNDFLGQWLELYDIDNTTPDAHLYPEFEETLKQSSELETRMFVTELIEKNLGVRNLIDSDFTFANRRLAEHYGINELAGEPITGLQMRKITLPADSERGGLLTQASVLKVTANGTVTSPVVRGNYVLTNILGTPVNPPPPNVGSIEPDTRGTTTIRETLDAHRNIEACALCHRRIDPPGFALESFDPIGGFRDQYRATAEQMRQWGPTPYSTGPAVDPSGVSDEGESFADIKDFKKLLLAREDQVAKHLVSQLIVYATGAEIQFADREIVEAILQKTRENNYPIRTIIHEVVQSDLFRNK